MSLDRPNIAQNMSSLNGCVLSIDLGTSGCKAAIVDFAGRVHASHFVPIETEFVGHDGAQQAPESWWQAFRDASIDVIARTPQLTSQIKAVCASTQGEGTIPLDESGNVLHPGLLWLDMRGREAICRRAGSGIFKVAGYNARKLIRWIRLTGGAPALSGKDPAAHMLYFKDSKPEIYHKTHTFLNVLDYINFRLTGRMVATPDSILTSWVTDNRDLSNIAYHDSLIDSLNLDRNKFPEIVPSTTIIGNVSEEVSNSLGLAGPIPVVAGSIDVSAAAIGSGAVMDGQVHLYVGTSSWIGAHVPFKRTDLFSQIASVPCARPDRYLMIGLQSAAGSNLSFLRDQIFFHGDERSSSDEFAEFYSNVDRISKRVPAGSRGIMYLPWLFGERSPVDDANVRAGLLNLSMQHTREDIIRAVLEGIALNTRWMLDSARKFLQRYSVDEISIVGGGGESDTWCQIFADVLNTRIRQIESPIHANLIGSAIIAGIGIGAIGFDNVAGLVKTRNCYEPDPQNRQVYESAYGSFRESYKRLAPLYRRLNRMQTG